MTRSGRTTFGKRIVLLGNSLQVFLVLVGVGLVYGASVWPDSYGPVGSNLTEVNWMRTSTSLSDLWLVSKRRRKPPETGASCEFETFGHQVVGKCTYYGACRVSNVDHMNKGDCMVGGGNRVTKEVCLVWQSEMKVNTGWCTEEGTCTTGTTSKVNSLDCRLQKEKKDRMNTFKPHGRCCPFCNKVYPFLGGLGNALHFSMEYYWTTWN